jgi:putative addiction module component (TIGR02574 family)
MDVPIDDVPQTKAQQAELDRRLASAVTDLADAIPWEALRAELAKRYSK